MTIKKRPIFGKRRGTIHTEIPQFAAIRAADEHIGECAVFYKDLI